MLLLLFLLLVSRYGSSHKPRNTFFSDQSPVSSKDILESFVKAHLVSTGTTIVGLCCRDGVVLGADTRSTGGPLVMDKNKLKIHTLADKIRCCAAGTSAVCDHLSRKVCNRLALDNIGIYQVTTADRIEHNTVGIAAFYISEELLKMAKSGGDGEEATQPKAVFILGGVDNEGPKLYQIDYESVPCRIAYGSLGSGSTDALAILESHLQTFSDEVNIDNPRFNLSIEQGIDIVRKAVKAGILNDLGSGSHVDLCVITERETKQWREHSAEIKAARLKDRNDNDNKELVSENLNDTEAVLGRRIWRPITTRLVIRSNKIEEEELTKYDDHISISLELLSQE